MQISSVRDPMMEAVVAKHKLTEFTDVGGEVTFELEQDEIEFIEQEAKKYDCSTTVLVRAILDMFMQQQNAN